MHQQRLVVDLDPGDADVPVAAPAAFHNIAPLWGKPGGHHIVDLAGDTVEPLRQVAALDLQHTIFCLPQVPSSVSISLI